MLSVTVANSRRTSQLVSRVWRRSWTVGTRDEGCVSPDQRAAALRTWTAPVSSPCRDLRVSSPPIREFAEPKFGLLFSWPLCSFAGPKSLRRAPGAKPNVKELPDPGLHTCRLAEGQGADTCLPPSPTRRWSLLYVLRSSWKVCVEFDGLHLPILTTCRRCVVHPWGESPCLLIFSQQALDWDHGLIVIGMCEIQEPASIRKGTRAQGSEEAYP